MNRPDETYVPLAAGRAVPGDDLEQLMVTYYDGVAPEELCEFGPRELLEVVTAHREAAAVRRAGEAVVRVQAAAAGATVDVVTDDMPFLVDSVTAEIARRGGTARLVLHPQLRVRRDASGGLQEAAAVDGEPESWIHAEVDGEADPPGLARDLQRVLAEVRAAVGDWPVMRREVLAARDDLAGVDEPDVQELRDLLTWLEKGHFTLLGAVRLKGGDRDRLELVPGSGLGLLRAGRESTQALVREVVDLDLRGLVSFTKASTRSPVHRPAYLDVVTVRIVKRGEAVDERRFVGLLATSAYAQSVTTIPVVRRKVADALALSGYAPTSHNGRDLLMVLETFPRDELFQIGVQDLTRTATGVLSLRGRRQTRLFLRRDDGSRWLSALVYLPRDRYSTDVRLAMAEVLREVFGTPHVDFTARVSESVLARLHFVVRVDPPAVLPEVDLAALESRLAAVARSWVDSLAEAATAQLGRQASAQLVRACGEAFPEAYKADFAGAVGLVDLQQLTALDADGPLALTSYAREGDAADQRRLKLYRDTPLSLSEVLPVLQSLGVDVLDERAYELHCVDGRPRWVYDFGLRYRAGSLLPASGKDPLLTDACAAVWSGQADTDGFNVLVTRGRLSWRQVVVLRAYAKYLRQTSAAYGQEHLEDVLAGNVAVASLLVRLFEARFDPLGAPPGAAQALAEEVAGALDDVGSLAHDRVLRALLDLVNATVRTDYFQRGVGGELKPSLSLKFDPQRVPGLPLPCPRHEVFVYSPRVEGVHLRFGAVARGGLRWSDRPDDFRTEVLGLAKAQMVKNSIIVPTGAKGGFVAKRLPDPAVDRAAWLAEGVASYRTFISGLLDVTDDLVAGEVVSPRDVVRLDGDDTYLVVAADKGTATFSDIANALALERGFWLGDAFASGGSAGYDHKAMGITARGAWESVKRHFRELSVDPEQDPITVVGIGDMSGDVFGNGMLLSRSLRLVVAFDHRHVFLDPDPDPAASYAERARLFALPRSSWADYDPSLISPGGGIHARTSKGISLTPEVRARLHLPDHVDVLAPQELIRAALLAPVDLLWNGGIGTYVKAATETHLQVGDKANNAVRVDGGALRARVVGEGGNLGFTQLGRIEYCLAGGRINTDAIDNSAGVDTSDHEVNFKILLLDAVREGLLTRAERDELLVDIEEDVARLVLRENYAQNQALATARLQAASMLPVHARFLTYLEERGLDRALEFLPGEAVLRERAAGGIGLTSSELAVLLAYAKIVLRSQLLESTLPDEPWFQQALSAYVPAELGRRYGDRLVAHPLRRQIVTTVVVNDVVDRAGITFVLRAVEETGATPSEVVRAYSVARHVFAFEELWTEVEALDGLVPSATQTMVLLEARRLLDRTTRWLLQARRSSLDVAAETAFFRDALRVLTPLIPELLVGAEAQRLERRTDELTAEGLPPALAVRTACLLDAFSLLDVVETAASSGWAAVDVARVYFALSPRFDIDRLLTSVSALPRVDRWQALARSAMRYDLYATLAGITSDVLSGAPAGAEAEAAISQWEHVNAQGLARARTTLADVLSADRSDLATLGVALRAIRMLLPG